MNAITWTDDGWRGAVRLCAEMKGYKPVFPNDAMARIDTYLYGDCVCRCRGNMFLFPFWNGKSYKAFVVCTECGRTVRKGGNGK